MAPLVEMATHTGQVVLMNELTEEAVNAEGGPFEICAVFVELIGDEIVTAEVKEVSNDLFNQALCKKYD